MRTASSWHVCTALLARTSPAPHSSIGPGDRYRLGPSAHNNSQGDPPTLGVWQHLAVSSLALLVVFSLFLSWMGPMLDHHFAERHPAHQHIYLGAANPDHAHGYQPFHSHSRLGMLLAASQTLVDPGDSVVIVTPASGFTPAFADITVPATAQFMKYGLDGAGALLGHQHGGPTIPAGASVAPPRHPPRT